MTLFIGALISVEAIKIDELVLDQVALALVATIAAAGYNRNLGLFEIGDNFLVLCEHLDRVWQDLGQLKIAYMPAT